MYRTVLTATAVSLAFSLPGFAQSGSDGADPQSPDAAMTGTGGMQDISAQNWSENIRNVFFTDATMTQLRPTDELSAGWKTLSEADQAVAIRDCQAFLMDAGAMGGASQGGVNASTTLSPEAEAAAEAGSDALGSPANDPTVADSAATATDTTTASNAPPSPGDATAWNQACSLVVSMDSPRATTSAPGN